MTDSTNSKRNITTLKRFYEFMAHTREVRARIVEDIFAERKVDSGAVAALRDALDALLAIPSAGDGEEYQKALAIEQSRMVDVDLYYEITELRKDLVYLEEGEDALLEMLADMHPGFEKYVGLGRELCRDKRFSCFITDRDGTTNNYCGRYRSSIQSVYNAVFLSRFAKTHVDCPIFITSAPLMGGGIVDVSVNPPNVFIYGASKGREFIDLNGEINRHAIDDEKQAALDRLNQRLEKMLESPSMEKFSLIGSGLQFKFGQTTIARQDINNSVTELESEAFLRRVSDLARELDPEEDTFRIEDTGLDIEIILTVEDEDSGVKDFDKADGVKYLLNKLVCDPGGGPVLVCGDTSSDVPMIKAALEFNKDTYAIFVTRKKNLADKVRGFGENVLVAPEPDMLVAALGTL